MITHNPVIVSNKDWQDLIGIQYALSGSDPKVGLNCYGLVREVYKGLNIELAEYQQSDLSGELAVDAAGNDWTLLEAPKPYAVTLIKSEAGRSGYHLAIVTPELTLLHSLPKKGVVVSPISRYADRILGFYWYTPGQGQRLPIADGDVGRIIGAVILTIVAVVASVYLGPMAAEIWGGTAAVWGGIIGAGVMMAGNLIINAIAPINPESTTLSGYTGDLADSRSYTWDGVHNDARQGLAKAMIFGIIKVGGQIIAERVWLDGNNDEYLDMLLCVAVGRITGLTTVQLNDNDISLFKYSGYTYRSGGDEQYVISWFDKVYINYGSSAKIPYDASSTAPANAMQFTTKHGIEGLSLLLSAPNGIFEMVNNIPVGFSVTLRIQYRVHGTSTWIDFPAFNASGNSALILRSTGTVPSAATNPKTLTDFGAKFSSSVALSQQFTLLIGTTLHYCTQITSDLNDNTITFDSFADTGRITVSTINLSNSDYGIGTNNIIPYIAIAATWNEWNLPVAAYPFCGFQTTVNIKGISFSAGCDNAYSYTYQPWQNAGAGRATFNIVYKRAIDSAWILHRSGDLTTLNGNVITITGLSPGEYQFALTIFLNYGLTLVAGYDNFWFFNISLDTSSTNGVFSLEPLPGNAQHSASLVVENPALDGNLYDFRIWRTTAEHTAVTFQDKVYLRGYSEITNKALTYPGNSLLAVRTMATDRISGGRPKVTSIATGIPLTLPATHYHVTSVWDIGIVTSLPYSEAGKVVLGLHQILVQGVITDANDADSYCMVWDASPGLCQTDRLLTKHFVTVPAWRDAGGGYTYLFFEGTEAIPDGTALTLFKSGSDPYVSRHTAWAVAKMLIEGSHGRITENNIDWDAFTAWDIWNMYSSKNKFNVNDPDVSLEYAVNGSSGAIYISSNYNTTGYIPVVSGAIYTLSHKDTMAWFDSNKAYISGVGGTSPQTHVAPANAAYLRTCCHNTLWSTLQVEIGSTQTAYTPYDPAHTEPRHLFDAVIDFTTDLWSLAMKTAQTARGNLFKKGNKYSVWVDKSSAPVQLFGEGNSNNVSINPIPRADRANILTTSFLDSATNYDQKDISIEDVQGNEYPIVKAIPVQVGIVRESQVTALLNYMLLLNRYVGSIINLEAGIDSIEVSLGDVFVVASQAKDFTLSGRLVSVTTGSTVTLDQLFTPEAGITYQLTVWGTTGTLYTWSGTLTGTDITTIPAPAGLTHDDYYEHPYVLAKATEERMKYRCIGIRRTADTMFANLTGIEYREEVYAND